MAVMFQRNWGEGDPSLPEVLAKQAGAGSKRGQLSRPCGPKHHARNMIQTGERAAFATQTPEWTAVVLMEDHAEKI